MTPLFGQGTFQTDPNMTPQQIERKRALMEAMRPRFGSAKYVGEGLGQLFTGINMGRQNRQLDRQENSNTQEGAGIFDRILSGASSRQPQGGTGFSVLGQAPTSEGQSVANDAMAAIGKQPLPAGASIRTGLVSRGMPEHIADAFIMNMQDESGLNPDINEKTPLVPGSRGGYGLIQWTGPRRRALEAYAQERGVPVSDMNMQLDFLMSELEGPESAAASRIFSTKDTGSAAAEIVNGFLRPAETHRAERESRYRGGASPDQQGGAVPLEQLYSAMASPLLSPEQRSVVASMIQQRQQEADPMRQQQLEKGQLEIDQMRNPQPGFRVLTSQEATSMGLPDGAFQVGVDGRVSQIGGAGVQVDVHNVPKDGIGGSYFQPVTPGQKKVDEAFAPEYLEWTRGGGVDMASQITRIDEVADELDAITSGESTGRLSGPLVGNMPDYLGTMLNPAAVQAREQVEEVVQRNLRLVLGAQFTENEGNRLISRAYNPRLPEAQNAVRLRRLAAAMKGASDARNSQMEYFAENGTLTGWQGKTWTMDDFFAAVGDDESAPLPQRPAPPPAAPVAAPAAQGGDVGAPDFSQMTMQDLQSIDAGTLTPEQFAAFRQRLEQILHETRGVRP